MFVIFNTYGHKFRIGIYIDPSREQYTRDLSKDRAGEQAVPESCRLADTSSSIGNTDRLNKSRIKRELI